MCLTVTGNKCQLIDLCHHIFDHKSELSNAYKLVITGADPVPLEVSSAAVQCRQDLRTTHKETDIIITQQVTHLTTNGKACNKVVASDTDSFVLMLHAYHEKTSRVT